MQNQSVESKLLVQLQKLSPEKQREVLDFARNLSIAGVVGTPGKDLLRFIGNIDPDDLLQMTVAIEENCELVESDEW